MLIFVIGMLFLQSFRQDVAPPIVLPEPNQVEAIGVLYGEAYAMHTVREWIEKMMTGLRSSVPTEKQSVQDSPLIEDAIQVDFHLQDGINTLYVYKDGRRYYAERPYQGIYQIDEWVFDMICEPEP